MKKMLSKLLVLFFALLCLGSAVPALAADVDMYHPVPIAEIGEGYIVYTQDNARADEMSWVYRQHSVTGQWQKRLWSHTYGEWRTDWIDCEAP